jgi:hypothetical protein
VLNKVHKNPEISPLLIILPNKVVVGVCVVLPHPDSPAFVVTRHYFFFFTQIGFDNDKTYKTYRRNSHTWAPALPREHCRLTLLYFSRFKSPFRASGQIRIVKEIEIGFMDIIIACESEGLRTQCSGSGMKTFRFGIRDKHPGSATLAVPVPYLNRKFTLSTPVEPFLYSSSQP